MKRGRDETRWDERRREGVIEEGRERMRRNEGICIELKEIALYKYKVIITE